jgi:hypothetical protein
MPRKPITDNKTNKGIIVQKDKKQEFSDRLNYLLDIAGLPPKGKGRQKALSAMFRVSQNGARKWIEGESIPHSTKSLPLIVEKFKRYGATAEWLLTGNQDYHPDKILENKIKLNVNQSSIKITLKFVPIPVVAKVRFSDNDDRKKEVITMGEEGGFIIFPGASTNSYTYCQIGDELKPRIKDGEYLVIDPDKEPQPGDEIIIKTVDGDFLIKKLLYIRDDKVHLVSVNENTPSKSYPVEKFAYMHKILAIANQALWHINK